MIQDAIDFSDIVTSIKAHQDPVSNGVVHIKRLEDIRDTLTELFYEIQKRNYNPKKCAYYMHPQTADKLYESDHMRFIEPGEVPEFQGRPIRIHPTIPEDVILFLAPNAIGLGGKVYNPEIVAYAD